MTVIDLNPDAATNPTRLDVKTIERWMLWPDDPDMRERAMQLAIVQFARDLKRDGALTAKQISDLADLAVDAPRAAEMSEAAMMRFCEGAVAGEIIYRAISRRELKPDMAAIGRNVEDVAQRLWPKYRFRPKTIHNKVLPRYRPVAHLWAAYVDLGAKWQTPFLCRDRDLPTFLAFAEEYRRLGETTQLPNAPGTILRPGNAVALPAGLRLPEITLEFVRSPVH